MATEDQRLRELHRFQILDTRRESTFDDLCDLVCAALDVPVAGIAFVDRDRIWFKSVVGLDVTEIPRSGSFIDAAMRKADCFEVQDALASEAFRQHPLVATPGGLRFFASVPLAVRPGLSLGVLCVGGRRPHRLTDNERFVLRRIARSVLDAVRLRRLEIERARTKVRDRAHKDMIAEQRSEIGKQRRLLEQTSRIARIGGWEYDVRRRNLVWSDEIFRILDLPVGKPPAFEAVPAFYREDVRDAVVSQMRDAVVTGAAFETEYPVVTAEGRARWVRCVCEAEVDRLGVARLIGTVQDVTELRTTCDEIEFIANHDVLTRLPNRAVFQDRLHAMLAEGDRHARHGVLLIDLDHFKEVNDTLGHQAGDALLNEVATRLRKSAGEGRLVARIGGDEFAVLVPNLETDAVLMETAERILGSFASDVLFGDESIPITTSIGAVIADAAESFDQILKDADIALYEAKSAGRNRIAAFDRSMRDEIELRQSILRAIRQAITRGELVLYYQPKMRLDDGGLAGFEALIRWRRPDGFVAGPSFFAAALEDPQLSQIIGDLVIDQALDRAADWTRRGLDFGTIAINVATSQFRRGDLADRILGGLARRALPSSVLTVEVTENVLLARDVRHVSATLDALSAAGVRIALDDFGTGYASLTHLKDFPVDILKIDRSFVAAIANSRESNAIVRAMIGLAHDLGVKVVCEGVETPEQRDIVADLGSDFAQGYLWSKPVPTATAEALFLEQPQLPLTGTA